MRVAFIKQLFFYELISLIVPSRNLRMYSYGKDGKDKCYPTLHIEGSKYELYTERMTFKTETKKEQRKLLFFYFVNRCILISQE